MKIPKARSGVGRIQKVFVAARPRTTVILTDKGRNSFLQYLKALEKVLRKASKAAAPEKKKVLLPHGKPARV